MNTSTKSLLGKLTYSAIFMLLLPAGLWFWAIGANHAVTLHPVQSTIWGMLLLIVGILLMLTGMHALWHFGKGLPMNAYPPPTFVQESVYALVPHPIYTGFVLAVFGIAIYAGDAAGFWLVGPIALLGCMALVWGFERPDLQDRFPDAPRRYLLAIPPDEEATPQPQHRVSVYLCLLLPWVLLNAAGFWMYSKDSPPAPFFNLPESVVSITLNAAIGALAIAWVGVAPFFANTQQQLRQYFISGMLGGLVVIYIAFVIPVIGLGHASLLENSFWVEALFSLSWFWVWVAARLYKSVFPGIRNGVNVLALALTYSLLANSIDPLSHLMSGLLGFAFAFYYPAIWASLRTGAEWVANSWKEWLFGPVRVINHGFYVGIATFLGVVIGGLLAGDVYAFPIVIFGMIGVICAGLWGQFLEGSDKLKRPFGYYGSLVGLVIASGVMVWMDVNVWVMLGIFSVFMPWVQGIGRLRCLVNGCCHGAVTEEGIGIHYVHPRSRVCLISGLKAKPLHPTQLYSMLWLLLVGGVQFRLWLGGAELSLIFGTYMMLNGLGRFVEEAYRGEPQTPVFGKLRLYQWAAVASIIAGIAITFIVAPMPVLSPLMGWRTFASATFLGFFVQFLMGIDFPRSNRRFSRLT